MRRHLAVAALAAALCAGVHGQTPAAGPGQEALTGLDPVLLVQGKEVDGVDTVSIAHHGLVYYFSSAETRATFERDPARYAVQLDGMCARMGPPVTGSSSLYAVHDGRIYAFGSPECKTRFLAAPAKYLDNGPSLMPPSTPEAAQEAQRLLARAVEAMGGAAVDSLTSIRERATSAVPTMDRGDQAMTTTLTIAFPDRWRRDTAGPYGEGALVVAGDAAFAIAARRAPRDLTPAARRYQAQSLQSRPLVLLRARRQPEFHAVALPSPVDAAVREVATSFDGVTIVLGIESATGRVISTRTRGRSPATGEVTELRTVFSDFRQAGPLTLPHRAETSAGGTPVPQQGFTVQEVEVNVPLDASLFKRPGA